MEFIGLLLSGLALFFSGYTYWQLNRQNGQIKMTRPNLVCFVGNNGNDEPKIVLRGLLYCTAPKGSHVQNLYVKMTNRKSTIIFPIWAYGDGNLVRGSGLFVDKTGISTYHHFLMKRDSSDYKFQMGKYKIQVFCDSVEKKKDQLSMEIEITLNEAQTKKLNNTREIWFNWDEGKKEYLEKL